MQAAEVSRHRHGRRRYRSTVPQQHCRQADLRACHRVGENLCPFVCISCQRLPVSYYYVLGCNCNKVTIPTVMTVCSLITVPTGGPGRTVRESHRGGCGSQSPTNALLFVYDAFISVKDSHRSLTQYLCSVREEVQDCAHAATQLGADGRTQPRSAASQFLQGRGGKEINLPRITGLLRGRLVATIMILLLYSLSKTDIDNSACDYISSCQPTLTLLSILLVLTYLPVYLIFSFCLHRK